MSSDLHWKAVVKPVAAASAAAVMAVVGLVPGRWLIAIEAGLAAGVLALLFATVITFLGFLITAPKKVRRRFTVPAGKFGRVVIGAGSVKLTDDIMQQEAALIAHAIDDLLAKLGRGEVEHPGERSSIYDQIERFGIRAKMDEWLPLKSRRRSLQLYREIMAAGDLDIVRQRCRAFQRRKPSF